MNSEVPNVEWIHDKLVAHWPGFGNKDEIVCKAIEVIWRNLRTTLDVATLVKQLPITRRTIERHFRRNCGCTISEARAFAKLELAKWLLTKTSFPIHAVAAKAGYASSDWMGKVIRRSTGLTPREYRQKNRLERLTP